MTLQYRFESFLLNPATRELHEGGYLVALPARAFDCLAYLIEHRDRAVGRDELIAAVWGRTEISEALLSHTIVKIRRALGDTGNEQRTIRTVPRFGYRWVGAVESGPAPAPAPIAGEIPVAATGPAPMGELPAPMRTEPVPAPRRVPRVARGVMLAVAGVACVLLLAVALVSRRASPPAPTASARQATVAGPAAPALVLPAEIDAPEPWRWLRLGVMDLVATRLRDGALPTLSSESVVGLLAGRDAANGEELLDDRALAEVATLRVLPRVRFADGHWKVRLDARGAQRSASAESEAPDAIQAAAAAADLLLRKLGHVPGGIGARPSSPALEELMQRSGAAMLADQLDEARALIGAAPADLQREPRVEERLAQLDLRAGDYAGVESRLHAALDRVTAATDPALRARMLITLAAANLRANQPEKAAPLYEEAIALRRNARDPEALGVAHLGRGAVLGLAEQYDAATAEFARARIELESAGDALGVASVDVNLGDLQLQRRRAADAQVMLGDAAREFERLGAREGRAHALAQRARAQLEMLDSAGALVTTDRFWPPASHTSNLRLRWTLAAVRAGALAAVGRPREAKVLLARIAAEADPQADALARAQAEALAARIDVDAGDLAAAAQHSGAALQPVLRAGDSVTWMRTALVRVRALGASGSEAAAAAKALHDCAGAGNDGCRLYAALADAAMDDAAGRREAALEAHAAAMRLAASLDVPEDLVTAAAPAVQALIASSHLDSARDIAGRIAPWASRDRRAAAAQAALFHALGDEDAARKADETVARLGAAGGR